MTSVKADASVWGETAGVRPPVYTNRTRTAPFVTPGGDVTRRHIAISLVDVRHIMSVKLELLLCVRVAFAFQ